MKVEHLIEELLSAKKQVGGTAPVGIRVKTWIPGEDKPLPQTITQPVVVRVEAGNVYLDPIPR